MREWLPALAAALGAKPPRHLPVWLARLIAGEAAVLMGTEARGASNAKPNANSAGHRSTTDNSRPECGGGLSTQSSSAVRLPASRAGRRPFLR